MAVAKDATSAGQTASGVTSISWTHTPVGTPTAVGVTTYGFCNSSPPTPTATYGGTSMTVADHAQDAVPDICYIFGLASPASGAKTVVISFGDTNYPVASSITVTGSDPATCFSNVAHATGASGVPTVACTSAAGELVLDVAGSDGSAAVTVTGPQTAYLGTNGTTNGGECANASTTSGASTVTPTYNSQSNPWAIVVASFKAAAAAAGIPNKIYQTNFAVKRAAHY